MTDFAANRSMMVDTQIRPSDVTKFPIIDAMLTVHREAYVPTIQREVAYVGDNIKLGGGRVILEPRTMAKMFDALDIQQRDMVLDIGCGLGYSSALLARMAEAVIAVEEDAEMVAAAEAALAEQRVDNVVIVQSPLGEGAAKAGPYDVIIIEGGVEDVPSVLLDQLKDGGRIAAIFTTGVMGECRIGYKIDGAVSWRMAFDAGAPILPGFEETKAFSL